MGKDTMSRVYFKYMVCNRLNKVGHFIHIEIVMNLYSIGEIDYLGCWS